MRAHQHESARSARLSGLGARGSSRRPPRQRWQLRAAHHPAPSSTPSTPPTRCSGSTGALPPSAAIRRLNWSAFSRQRNEVPAYAARTSTPFSPWPAHRASRDRARPPAPAPRAVSPAAWCATLTKTPSRKSGGSRSSPATAMSPPRSTKVMASNAGRQHTTHAGHGTGPK